MINCHQFTPVWRQRFGQLFIVRGLPDSILCPSLFQPLVFYHGGAAPTGLPGFISQLVMTLQRPYGLRLRILPAAQIICENNL